MGANQRFQRIISLGVGGFLLASLVTVSPGSFRPIPAAAVATYPPVNVYVGYADNLRSTPFFPNPWSGSANTTFVGSPVNGVYDSGGIRINNPSGNAFTVSDVSVDIGSYHYDLWGSNTLPANGNLVLAQTGYSGNYNFDTSDTGNGTCSNDQLVPTVHVTINGITTNYTDTRQVLNTGGRDVATCPNGTNESHQWQQVGGGPGPGETQGGGSPSEPPTTCHNGRNPINCATGEFYHNFLDLAVAGRGMPIAFTHTYSSQAAAQNGPLGFGWTDLYNMSLAVDPSSGVVTITEETGSQVTFTPVPSGYEPPSRVRATLVKNGDGSYSFTRFNGRQFLFNASGQLLRESDRNGYATVLAYNGSGQLSAVTDSAGRSLNLTYWGSMVSSVTDPINRKVSFAYDGSGNLVAATDVNGGVTHFTYDSNHLLLAMTDPRGGLVTNVYDSNGRVTSQTDAMNRTANYAYTATGTTITDARGNVEVQQYQNNELTAVTKGSGTSQVATWRYGYDQSTLGLTSMTDPNNHAWSYTYDSAGNLLTSVDPLNRKSSFTYDGLNDITAMTDPSQVTTTLTYDSAGNLKSVSRPLISTSQNRQTTFIRNDSAHPGDVTGVVDPLGNTSTFAYDAAGNAISSTDPLGNKVTMAYDGIGRRISIVTPRGNVAGGNPSGFTTSYMYDPFGDVTKVVDPLGHTATATYDANRNRTMVTDPLGRQTSYTYDADNEMTKVTRADQSTWTSTFDADANLTSQVNGLGNATTYAYDALNRVTSTIDPLNRATRFGYDGAGRTTTVTDAAGQVASYSYDAANEPTGITYSDGKTPNVAYAYDAVGRRTSMTDGTGTSTYTYDSLNQLTQSTNGAGQSVSYGYDLAGRLTALTYPGSQVVSRGYDVGGHLTSIADWLSHSSTFAYDADGNLVTQNYPNTTQATYAYDAADQLNSVTDSRNGSAFAGFTYARDANGQLTSEASTGMGQPGQSYSYDQVNRLAGANGSTYGYDAADQIVKLASGATLAYDAAGQLSSINRGGAQTSFTYDVRGNRAAGISPVGTPASYTYDQENRLTGFHTTPPAASTLISGGEYHSLAVRVDGTAWAWGFNAFGQLGNGTTTNSSLPGQIPGIVGATGVAAGAMHSVMLKADGSVWTWGFNGSGQLGAGTTTNSSTPLPVAGVAGATQVAAGNNHTLARKSDGTVADWGQNDAGQLGNGATSNSSVPVTVSGLSGVTAVAGGGLPGAPGHSLALKSDGTVWAWGYGKYGQLGNGGTTNALTPVQVSGLGGITAIAANGNNSYALRSDGTVWAWGDNSSGQLGNGSAAKTSLTPVQVSISGATGIAAGGAFALALKSDGSAWAWGNDSGWQLGDGGICGRGCSTPIQITALSGIVAMSGGYTHGLAITSSGSVQGWGQNGSGQLGNGSTSPSSTPVQSSNIANVKQAPASGSYTYDGDGLRASKTVSGVASQYAWDLSGEPLVLRDGSLSYVYGPNNRPLEQISASGTVLYFHVDQLGSTRLLTDASGATSATYGYDAYGNFSALTGSVSSALGFAAEYRDSETGFQYLRARYYDTTTAQFVTRDPLSAATGRPYAYAGGNPANRTDPSGLLTVGVCGTGNGMLLFVNLGVGACVVTVVGKPNETGVTGTPFGGVGVGINIGGSGAVLVSNANSLQDLTGWFGYFTVSGELGIGVDVVVFYGWNSAGQFIFGGVFGATVGAGADAAGGASYTWILHRFSGWQLYVALGILWGLVGALEGQLQSDVQQQIDEVQQLLQQHGVGGPPGAAPSC
jgi:RHS repeat-associated protein